MEERVRKATASAIEAQRVREELEGRGAQLAEQLADVQAENERLQKSLKDTEAVVLCFAT